MFDYSHYVPILKGKMGEFNALQTLTSAARARLTPVIDVPPLPWDYQKGAPKRTLTAHLQKVISTHLVRSWDPAHPLFLDLTYCVEEGDSIDGVHPLIYVLRLAGEKGFHLIPTTSLDAQPGYQRALADAWKKNSSGLCVRINRSDFGVLSELPSKLLHFLQSVGADMQETDLIIDIRACHEDEISQCVQDAKSVIGVLPQANKWRTLTLAGSGFPSTLPNPPNSEERLPRTELRIWKGVLAANKELKRLPSFGDYGIEDPDHKEIDPRTMRMSANLRYTTENDWIVLKGSWVRKTDGVKFPDLCKTLINRKEFRKADFSWGDEYISQCSRGMVGPGNATIWRKVGTNHHLTLVGEQVTNERDA